MANSYAKGSVSDCHKDWFHGELTRDEAIYALKQSGEDCFLVRESKKTLVLSLSYRGQICHIKIKYGPGWYKLDGARDSFKELQDLVNHYSDNTVKLGGKSKGTLEVACKKVSPPSTTIPGQKHDIASITLLNYIVIEPEPDVTDSTPDITAEKDWFHGEMTEIKAEQILAAFDSDCFLIRKTKGALFLSIMHEGQFHHIKIKYRHGWYELESGSAKYFNKLDDLIAYYSKETISSNLNITLWRICTGKYL